MNLLSSPKIAGPLSGAWPLGRSTGEVTIHERSVASPVRTVRRLARPRGSGSFPLSE
ncbi:hypothetical protein [Brachybacterium sacelli]|uniref:hypothetical protein n=1 Tax=Brachybacterium sacelli TaxID=173364 RepID=UPI003619BACE